MNLLVPTLFFALLCIVPVSCQDLCEDLEAYSCSVHPSCLSAECTIDLVHDFGSPFGTVDLGSCSMGLTFDNCRLPFVLTFYVGCGDSYFTRDILIGEDECNPEGSEVNVDDTWQVLNVYLGTVDMRLNLALDEETETLLVGGMTFSICTPEIPLVGRSCYDVYAFPLTFPTTCGGIANAAASENSAAVHTIITFVMVPIFLGAVFGVLIWKRNDLRHRFKDAGHKKIYNYVLCSFSVGTFILSIYASAVNQWSDLEDIGHLGMHALCLDWDDSCIPLLTVNMSQTAKDKILVVNVCMFICVIAGFYGAVAGLCRVFRPKILRCHIGCDYGSEKDIAKCITPQAYVLYKLGFWFHLVQGMAAFTAMCLWSAVSYDHIQREFGTTVTMTYNFFFFLPFICLASLGCAVLSLTNSKFWTRRAPSNYQPLNS